MTPEQIDFRKAFYQAFEDHNYDLFRTITWWNAHGKYLYMNDRKTFDAFRSLDSKEVNQVICEILLPF